MGFAGRVSQLPARLAGSNLGENMKRLIQCITVGAVLVAWIPLGARAVETRDITDLLRYVNQNTVLVFDIDNTILTSGQFFGTTKWGWNNVSRLEKAGRTHEEAMSETHALFHRIWRQSEPRLVDDRIPQLIRRFQDLGVKVIGLSNRDPSLAYVTADQLAQLGIDLTRTSLDGDDFRVFSETETLYVEGCIFVGDMGDKGKALDAFLRMVLQLPDSVVYVDDRRQNVDKVGAALRSLRVDYTGVWYRKGDDWVANYDQSIADIQQQHFGSLLSNEDAEKLLKAGIKR
jgi:hypothetical protein